MEKTPWNLIALGSLYGQLEPGDIFYVLNDKNPHVVVMILEEGVVDEEGRYIKKWRPVRYPGEKVEEFYLMFSFFESGDIEIEFDDDPPVLPKGAVIVIYDLEGEDEENETIPARIEVIKTVDVENRLYITMEGSEVAFDDRNFLPSGAVYTPDGEEEVLHYLEVYPEGYDEVENDVGLRGEQD